MEIARHWRLRKQRYSLIGNFHPDADGGVSFPPGPNCPRYNPITGELILSKSNGNGHHKVDLAKTTVVKETSAVVYSKN